MRAANVDGSLAASTLASNDVISGNLVAVGDEEFRLLSLTGLWSLRGATAGEGPLMFGVAHSDYTDAEIEECLEVSTGLTRGDKVAQEQASRLVRRIGQFPVSSAAESFREGEVIKTRLNWHITEGQTLKAWIWNKSGAALTTGALVLFNGDAVIRWT